MAEPEHIETLRALAAGDYARWRGLPIGLERAALDDVLDGEHAGDTHSGILAGLPATYVVYPPAPAAPSGVQAWFDGDQVAALEIREPVMREPLEAQLGEPEARIQSGLGGSYRQWVYAERGLVVHISRITGAALRLYAFPACPTETFLAHPLSKVERRRIRREG